MRELLIKEIKRRYEKDGLDEIYGNRFENNETLKKAYSIQSKLEAGEITIDQYLNLLSDKELIDVFDGQCCQQYR